VIAFLDEAPPEFPSEQTVEGAAPAMRTDDTAEEPSLVDMLLERAVGDWREGRFANAKRSLDRVIGRDVLHDERDVVIRLSGALRARGYSPTAWAREAKRELVVVTLARITAATTAEVRHVLGLIHRCDPIGVAARDEAEMVKLQAAWDGAPRIVVEMADRALDVLEGEVDYPELTQRFGLSADELKSIRATLRRYRATPVDRLVLGADETSYDISFFREGPTFVQESGWRGEVPAQPTEQLEALGRAVLDRLEDFMRYGVEKLEPIEVSEIAEAAGLTVDQVGRVSDGVRVDTPWGILAMRHFLRSSPRLGVLGD
jgi:DNA-directed RNA polymerase specialized sigma54-like protein